MRLAPALAFFVAFALAGTLAAKVDPKGAAQDDADGSAQDGVTNKTYNSVGAMNSDSNLWGEFHPGASEAFYLELGDETFGYGKLVFQQDDSARGVVSCFLHDAPRNNTVYSVFLTKGTQPAHEADKEPQVKGQSESGGVELEAEALYDQDKVVSQPICTFTPKRDLDWKQLTTQPDYFRNGFTWKRISNDMTTGRTDPSNPDAQPARQVTATLKPCTGEKVDCFLPQNHQYNRDARSYRGPFYYTWDSDTEDLQTLVPESGFPKEIVADVNKAFYWDVGNAQNGTGIFSVHPLDDGSGSLSCFSAHQIDKAKGGILSALVFNATGSGLDVGALAGFEGIDAHTKVITSLCSWIPSTLLSSDQIKTMANHWAWMTIDNNSNNLGWGRVPTEPEACSSRSDSLCDLSKAKLLSCTYNKEVYLPLCQLQFGPETSLPTKFAGDASDAFFVEVGDHVKGKVVFQKDERSAAIMTCFSPNGQASTSANTTVQLAGNPVAHWEVFSHVGFTASYNVLSDGRVRQDCSLTAYTEPVWKTLLSAEWNHMTWNVTLTADHQPRVSTVGEPSPKMDCAKASDGGCKLLDFVGCVSEDAYSEVRDFNHCTFEGKAEAHALT